MTPNEEWRPVVGWEEFYEVSSLGRVRSLDRRTGYRHAGHTRASRGRVLRSVPSGRYVGHSLSAEGRRRTFRVHTLVAAAFLGPRPEGRVVCHNNGDGADNRLENLRYDTPTANLIDIVVHGKNQNAAKTHCIHGHEYTDENTYWRGGPRPARDCRACIKNRAANRSKSRAA